MIVVTPKTQIAENDVITIKIKANTTEPYKKEISCEVSLRVKQVVLNSYSIDDVTNRNYAILKLVNAKETGMPVTLEFDPNVVRVDLADEAYVNKIEGSEVTDSKGFVKKFTFNIKFYKVNMSKNYTYPSGDTACVIRVTNNQQ